MYKENRTEHLKQMNPSFILYHKVRQKRHSLFLSYPKHSFHHGWVKNHKILPLLTKMTQGTNRSPQIQTASSTFMCYIEQAPGLVLTTMGELIRAPL